MRRYKFDLGGSYIYFFGENMGDAIASFVAARPNRTKHITAITEEPLQDYERP